MQWEPIVKALIDRYVPTGKAVIDLADIERANRDNTLRVTKDDETVSVQIVNKVQRDSGRTG